MSDDPRRGMPDILARLRRDAEGRTEEPRASRWARPIGIAIAVAIAVVIIIAATRANPL